MMSHESKNAELAAIVKYYSGLYDAHRLHQPGNIVTEGGLIKYLITLSILS